MALLEPFGKEPVISPPVAMKPPAGGWGLLCGRDRQLKGGGGGGGIKS